MSSHREDRSVYNGHIESEVVIDRPVSAVWKQFLDAGSWITSHQVETVHGTPGTLGSITRVTWRAAIEQGMPPPHYHYCKIVELHPENRQILKTFSEEGGSYGMQITAFDDTRFVEYQHKTRVVFNFYVEIRSEAIAKNPTSISLDSSKEGMLQNLLNLKRLVEAK